MIRWFTFFLLAIGLTFAPASARDVAAAAMPVADCAAAGGMNDMEADREAPACCTVSCTMAGAAGIFHPGAGLLAELSLAKSSPRWTSASRLDSLALQVVDPPPRLPLS